jgi:hypothetical protein
MSYRQELFQGRAKGSLSGAKKMRFIRVHGRVIPIKDGNDVSRSAQRKKLVGGNLITGGLLAHLHGQDMRHSGLRVAKEHFGRALASAKGWGMESEGYLKHKPLARAGAKAFVAGTRLSKIGMAAMAAGTAFVAAGVFQGRKKKA